MGLLGSFLKGTFSPHLNGRNAAKAAPIIARITAERCDETQISSLRWWADRNVARRYVWNEFEYAMRELHSLYRHPTSSDHLKQKILAEFHDFHRAGLITDEYVISLYQPSE